MEVGNLSAPLPPEVHDLLALHLVPGLGPRLTAALLERFGSAEAVLRAGVEELRRVPYLGEGGARDIHQAAAQADVGAGLEVMARHHVPLRALGTADQPAAP